MTQAADGIYIIDDHSEIFEIVAGRRTDRADGYSYTVDQAKGVVYRVGGQGLVDGEFTPHESREALDAAINLAPSR